MIIPLARSLHTISLSLCSLVCWCQIFISSSFTGFACSCFITGSQSRQYNISSKLPIPIRLYTPSDYIPLRFRIQHLVLPNFATFPRSAAALTEKRALAHIYREHDTWLFVLGCLLRTSLVKSVSPAPRTSTVQCGHLLNRLSPVFELFVIFLFGHHNYGWCPRVSKSLCLLSDLVVVWLYISPTIVVYMITPKNGVKYTTPSLNGCHQELGALSLVPPVSAIYLWNVPDFQGCCSWAGIIESKQGQQYWNYGLRLESRLSMLRSTVCSFVPLWPLPVHNENKLLIVTWPVSFPEERGVVSSLGGRLIWNG